MRPNIRITIYSHDKTTTHIVKTVYHETPESEPLVKYDVCTCAGELYRKVQKHIRHAKEMTYDYKVDFQTFYL